MSSGVDVDIPKTFGALLIGAVFASLCVTSFLDLEQGGNVHPSLSGGITVQTLVYFKLYPSDASNVKTLVLALWLLDACHTALIWSSQWEYFIRLYGMAEKIDYISTTLALSIVITGVLTFLVHSIFLLSKRKWYLVAPVVRLLLPSIIPFLLRLIRQGRHRYLETCFSNGYNGYYFREHVRWLFTLGLALSSAVDVLITSSLFILDGVIDTLILYTFETGAVTCAATIVSMICWISIPTQLIFMALHFIIGKFYTMSLLVTLNTRRGLRDVQSRGSSSGRGRTAFVLDNRRPKRKSKDIGGGSDNGYDLGKVTELQINVERSVQYTRDSYTELTSAYGPNTP
ncbi:hypothetical protein F5876DRAFT_64928 [Lentinula aff. lateritia]|uniref:Uncharacterized protein n=1 Tax=Lentinula aff. lateritia TaxID=2804960 RepID=A0ACC1U2G7_9AGAR|nr:hypothetical protein F5876DRAFT_64928 [Lentinula aff. lateritia]